MQGEYFFVRPEKVYELLVQSYFESIEGVLSVINAKKSSLTYETTIPNSDTTFTNNSEPDLVVEFSNNGKIIVDAKWKILDLTKDSPFDSYDLLKLERDLRVRTKKDDQSFNLLLVYPLVRGVNSDKFLEFKVNYNEHDIVNFKIQEVSFDLGNY